MSWKIPGVGKPHPVVREQVGPGEGGRQFALDLFKSQPTGQDLVLCAPAVQQLLHILSEGSAGKTKAEIDKAIYTETKLSALGQLISALKVGVTLEAAQRVYTGPSLHVKPEFARLAKSKFDCEFLPRSDQAAVNKWINDATGGKIQSVPPDDLKGTLTLINVLYLKAEWEEPFELSNTSPADFYSAGQKLKVSTMFSKRDANFAETSTFSLLELPFKGERLVFDCILPKKRDGLQEVERDLTRARLDQALKVLKPEEVLIHLPRFHQEMRVALIPGLQRLGIRELFQPDIDLGKLTSDWVQINVFSQIVWLDVNEAGAEAAAVTIAGASGTPVHAKDFIADHPFMFLIRDRVSGTILFIGRVVHPGRKW